MNLLENVMNNISPSWGICSFDEFRDYLIPCRGISKIPENAKSIIVALFPYYLGEEAYKDSNISRYAVVPDYNIFMKSRLETAIKELTEKFPSDKFVSFCDNSPLPEVVLAQKAGLGSKGVNGLLITEKYGSWVFIGEIVTTLTLEPSKECKSLCDGCNLRINACPSGALSDKGFNPERCLSAISQQKKPFTAEQEQLILNSGCAWGCDVCQVVCPKNRQADKTEIEEFINGVKLRAEYGDDLSDRAYGWRGSKVIERNLDLFK